MQRSSSSVAGRLGLLSLLWLVGLYLRIPMLIAPPLAPDISADLGLGQAATGALTTLPVLMLAVGAVFGSWVIARLGVKHTVLLGLAVAAMASAARGIAPPAALLYLATGLMGLGIAVMQPGMAALANAWCPGFVALAVGVYMNGMYVGEFLSAGTTRLFVLPLAGGDWRLGLLFWSLPVLPIALALYFTRGKNAHPAQGRASDWPDWRNGAMWRLGLLLSGTSVLFMGTNAYMSDILGADSDAGSLQSALFWFNFSQVVASLLMIPLASRLVLRRWPLIAAMLTSVAGGLYFVFVGGTTGLVAAFVLSMAAAFQLSLVVMAAPYLAAPGETGRVSAGIFCIGYSLGFAVPLIAGIAAGHIGRPWTAMLFMLAYAAAVFPLALTLKFRPRPAAS